MENLGLVRFCWPEGEKVQIGGGENKYAKGHVQDKIKYNKSGNIFPRKKFIVYSAKETEKNRKEQVDKNTSIKKKQIFLKGFSLQLSAAVLRKELLKKGKERVWLKERWKKVVKCQVAGDAIYSRGIRSVSSTQGPGEDNRKVLKRVRGTK